MAISPVRHQVTHIPHARIELKVGHFHAATGTTHASWLTEKGVNRVELPPNTPLAELPDVLTVLRAPQDIGRNVIHLDSPYFH